MIRNAKLDRQIWVCLFTGSSAVDGEILMVPHIQVVIMVACKSVKCPSVFLLQLLTSKRRVARGADPHICTQKDKLRLPDWWDSKQRSPAIDKRNDILSRIFKTKCSTISESDIHNLTLSGFWINLALFKETVKMFACNWFRKYSLECEKATVGNKKIVFYHCST